MMCSMCWAKKWLPLVLLLERRQVWLQQLKQLVAAVVVAVAE